MILSQSPSHGILLNEAQEEKCDVQHGFVKNYGILFHNFSLIDFSSCNENQRYSLICLFEFATGIFK